LEITEAMMPRILRQAFKITVTVYGRAPSNNRKNRDYMMNYLISGINRAIQKITYALFLIVLVAMLMAVSGTWL